MKRRWACAVCGRSGTSKLETRIVFHACRPAKRNWRGAGGYAGTTLDEARATAFAEWNGGARPPTQQQAKNETDKKRRLA